MEREMDAINKIKPKLLIVEDDYDNQKFLQLLLEKKYSLYFCDNADAVYDTMDKNSFNVVIMDISLRGSKNGLQIIKELRSDDKNKHLPIICLTAHAFSQDRENALNAGANVYLSKPVENQVLLQWLSLITEESAA